MTKLTKTERSQILSDYSRRIYDLLSEAQRFANENDMNIYFDNSYYEFRELNEWEAESLEVDEGTYAWVSSSSFC